MFVTITPIKAMGLAVVTEVGWIPITLVEDVMS